MLIRLIYCLFSGVLAAPVPFQVGVHSSFILKASDGVNPNAPRIIDYEKSSILKENACAIKVYLDFNRIIFGEEGRPPPLPEARGKKLLDALLAAKGGAVFQGRDFDGVGMDSDWTKHKLPHFDEAFSFEAPIREYPPGNTLQAIATVASPPSSIDGEAVPEELALDSDNIAIEAAAVITAKRTFSAFSHDDMKESEGTGLVNEVRIRHAFLNFFVAVFKNYRKYLVYSSRERPSPLCAFRNEAFLSGDCLHYFTLPLTKTSTSNT